MIEILAILLCNLIIFFNLKKVSNFINICDRPDKILKKHISNVPLLGGVIIIINILVYFFLIFFFNTSSMSLEFPIREKISIFLLIVLFFLMGIYDDKFKLTPNTKLILSILISILVLSLNNNLLIRDLNFSFLDRNIFIGNFHIFLQYSV